MEFLLSFWIAAPFLNSNLLHLAKEHFAPIVIFVIVKKFFTLENCFEDLLDY